MNTTHYNKLYVRKRNNFFERYFIITAKNANTLSKRLHSMKYEPTLDCLQTKKLCINKKLQKRRMNNYP